VEDRVHLDVVGVPVTAVPVVADRDVGALLVEHGREPRGGLLEGCHGEGALVRVLLPAAHPGVGVAEPDDPGQPQDGCGCLGLPASAVDDRLARFQVVGGLTVVAVGGEDDDHPASLVDGAGHGARGLRGLVVGMGVEEHDGGHLAILPGGH
jgi:hypothetical protein